MKVRRRSLDRQTGRNHDAKPRIWSIEKGKLIDSLLSWLIPIYISVHMNAFRCWSIAFVLHLLINLLRITKYYPKWSETNLVDLSSPQKDLFYVRDRYPNVWCIRKDVSVHRVVQSFDHSWYYLCTRMKHHHGELASSELVVRFLLAMDCKQQQTMLSVQQVLKPFKCAKA